jgi:hypothetical protein
MHKLSVRNLWDVVGFYRFKLLQYLRIRIFFIIRLEHVYELLSRILLCVIRWLVLELFSRLLSSRDR